MQKLILVQKLRPLLVLFFIGMSLSFAFAQNKFSSKDYKILLDSLETAHDQAGFRLLVNQSFRQLKKTWPKQQLEKNYLELLESSKELMGSDHRITALILHQSGIHQYLEDNLDTALVLLEQSIQLRKRLLPSNHSELGHSFYLLGRTHYYLDNNLAAIEAFKESCQIYENQQDCAMVVNSLRMLGDTYDYLEEQALAEAYFDLVLSNARQCYDLDNPALANLYLYAANVFSNNPEEKAKTLSYYQASQQVFERGNNEGKTNYASVLINQGEVLIDFEQYNKAWKVLNQAFLLKQELGDETELDIYYENIGAIYRRQKQYDQSFKAYQKSLEIRKNENDLVSKEMNYAYHNLGEVYQESGDFPQAATYYQKAMQAADANFASNDFTKNPEPADLDLSVEYTDLIKDLDFKGQLFFEWYQAEGAISNLKIALLTYQRAIELIEDKRGDLITEGSKLFWQEKLFPVFENALAVAFEAYQKERLPEIKELIFAWMEQSKSLVLLESLVAQQKEFLEEESDSLRLQIESLAEQVSGLQRRFIENNADENLKRAVLKAQIDLWETKRLLKQDMQSIDEELLTIEKMGLVDFQAQLREEAGVFVEYFLGRHKVYALCFNKDQSSIFSSKLDHIPEQTKTLRNLLASPNQSLEAFHAFQKIGHGLYLQLLDPVTQVFKTTIDRITIIPDGILAALPFEVLLEHPTEQEKVYYGPDRLPYVINQYAINYAFSIATLVQQLSNRKQDARFAYVGLAPAFESQELAMPSRQCNQGNLAPLLENTKEVETIQGLLNGKIASGKEATKAFFLKEGMKAQVLHLATHACIDNVEPARSKIFFSDDHLYAHELYQLELEAQMVVLSACETGVGVFQRGEGVMSLARGFAQSGAPSLTLSYWSVSDQSTAQLMENYYTALSKGETKDKALRSAKLNFLQNQNEIQRLHPYYWSAFVHFGDVESMTFSHPSNFKWSFAIAVMVVLMLLVVMVIRKRKSIALQS